jgi:hypothetical protein
MAYSWIYTVVFHDLDGLRDTRGPINIVLLSLRDL